MLVEYEFLAVIIIWLAKFILCMQKFKKTDIFWAMSILNKTENVTWRVLDVQSRYECLFQNCYKFIMPGVFTPGVSLKYFDLGLEETVVP